MLIGLARLALPSEQLRRQLRYQGLLIFSVAVSVMITAGLMSLAFMGFTGLVSI